MAAAAIVLGAMDGHALRAAQDYSLDANWPQLPSELQAKLKTCRDGQCDGQVNAIVTGEGGTVWMLTRFDPPLIQVDAAGRLLKAFGHGTFATTHGMCMDRAGHLWAGDASARPASGTAGAKGLQVHKFSQDGKLLLSLGKAGEAGTGPDRFVGPTACAVATNGDVLIADGHIPRDKSSDGDRILRFTAEGKFVAEYGRTGSGPGEFRGIHAMAFDSRQRLFVADRSNNRVQVLDPQMKFVAEWRQFGRPSGLAIIGGDTLVVTDWESGGPAVYSETPGAAAPAREQRPLWNIPFMQGRSKPTTFGTNTNTVRIGSTADGSIRASFETMKAEGVGASRDGHLYVGPWKYIPGK